jgi:hypothetical protein
MNELHWMRQIKKNGITSSSDRRKMNSSEEKIIPLMLHTSIHDDAPCLCIDCQNLRRLIEQNARAQPPLPKAA